MATSFDPCAKAIAHAVKAAKAATAAERDLGLVRDIPVARFRDVLLPHQQAAFNIFQPQLVHMFETLLATPLVYAKMGGLQRIGGVGATPRHRSSSHLWGGP